MYWFFIGNFYWIIPVVLLIAWIGFKKQTWKITLILLHSLYGIGLLLVAPHFSGGGGFGDVIIGLMGVLSILSSIIQAIITFFSFKRRKNKTMRASSKGKI